MKWTLTTLLALSCTAMAVTESEIADDTATTGHDVVISADQKNLTINAANTTVTTTGKYEIGTVKLNHIKSLTLNFGSEGALTIGSHELAGDFPSQITLSVDFSELEYQSIGAGKDVVHTFITASNGITWGGNWKMPEFFIEPGTYTQQLLALGYTFNTGISVSVDELEIGEIGFVFVEGTGDNATDTFSLVVKHDPNAGGGGAAVPEPTTATLSLLALAGLASRRRRK